MMASLVITSFPKFHVLRYFTLKMEVKGGLFPELEALSIEALYLSWPRTILKQEF